MSIKSVQTIFGEVVQATSDVVMPAVIYNLGETNGTVPSVTAINYQYGHEKEISARIADWSKVAERRNLNFPLIWLREDIRFGNNGDFQTVIIPSIVIAWNTKPNYDSQQREIYSFQPVLRPIYRELLRQIARCREFRIYDPIELYRAQMIEHKFWGTPEDTQAKNVFANHVDAIEILNMEIPLQEHCLTSIN